MNLKITCTLFLLAFVATTAQADGPYVVGEVSHSNLSLDKGTFNKDLTSAGATGLTSKDDGSGNEWRIQAGYKFTPYLAIEGGYIDLGQVDYKANFAGGTAKGTEKAGGFDLAVLGMYPITDNLSVFAKGGVIAAKVDTKLSSAALPAAHVSDASTEVRPLAGAGFTYGVMKNVDLRFDYDHVFGIGNSGKGGKMNDDIVSAGISYSF
jgi:opacity protein-like surface antigen